MQKLFTLYSLIFIIFSGRGPMTDFLQSLPDHIRGWKITGEDRVYDRGTLFDYMNGGAEVYLAFDFRRVRVNRFKRPDGIEMTLDIYEMGSAPEAFGIFSCDPEDEEVGIGQGSRYGFGLLRFWKGPYFVTVMADAEGEEVDRAVLELGREIDKLLGPEGPEPEMLSILPQARLIKNRVSYFHSNIHLNNRFYIASENILNLDSGTECVFAEYRSEGEEPVSLLVIRYGDANKAISAYRSFLSNFVTGADVKGPVRTENHKWIQAQVTGDTLAVVFDAPNGDLAKQMLTGIKYKE
jgi:hypothetical protein